MAIVYMTTNLITNKKYIGVDTKNDPTYFGSGRLLKKAITKYGIDNFKKETLKEFENPDEAFMYERQLITSLDAQASKEYYNIHEGGKGGKTWVGDFRPQYHCDAISEACLGRIPWNKGGTHSDETKKKLSEVAKKRKLSNETKQRIRDTMKQRWADPEYRNAHTGENNPIKGIKRSEEFKENLRQIKTGVSRPETVKQKISETLKGRSLSEEHKQNIANGNKGGKRSEETKQKMREAWVKRKSNENKNL